MEESTPLPSALQLTKAFWRHLVVKRKRQLGALMVLMVAASFAEVLSLGAVLPFLGVLTAPEKIFTRPGVEPVLRWFGIQTPQELLLPITLVFIVAALVAGAMRLALLYANTRLSHAIGADFSYQIYRRTLYQPYAVHVSRNSSQIISGITGKSRVIIQGLLLPLLTLVSSTLILVALMAALLVVSPGVSLMALTGFAAIYWLIVRLTRKRMALNSQRLAKNSTQVIKVLQEGLGGIRDVLIDGNQEAYCQNYRRADVPLRHAQASTVFIGKSPKFAVEALGMGLIAILAYILVQQTGGVAGAITTLGVLAVGAQRLLPVLQQSYSSVVAIRGGKASLVDALELLDQPVDPHMCDGSGTDLSFSDKIQLSGIGFRYVPDGPPVLQDISLTIAKGSRIGFIGATGSGKSTLLDIVMGLLPANEGAVLIDNVVLASENRRAWQDRIAHVPQAIYLADGSIAENIAFGVQSSNIDMDRVHDAASRAQIAGYIESLPSQYETRVGERGVRLSGGQRQRIGIARALYRRAEVIVFDEATSALDNNTEQAVMAAIEGLGSSLTILIIAHRLSTLRHCDRVVELQRGHLIRSGTYNEIVSH